MAFVFCLCGFEMRSFVLVSDGAAVLEGKCVGFKLYAQYWREIDVQCRT